MARAAPRIGRHGRGPGDRIEPRSKRPPAWRRPSAGPGTAATAAENWRHESHGYQRNLLNCWNLIEYSHARRPGADGPRHAAFHVGADGAQNRRRPAARRHRTCRRPEIWHLRAAGNVAIRRFEVRFGRLGRGARPRARPESGAGLRRPVDGGDGAPAAERMNRNPSPPARRGHLAAGTRRRADERARRRKKGTGRAGPESGGNPGRKLHRSYRLARQCLLTL